MLIMDKEHAMDLFRSFYSEVVKRHIPDAKIEFKDKSKLMQFIGFIAKPFCPAFLTSFTTVIGKTVYFPSINFLQENYAGSLKILAHEFVHLIDAKDSKGLFAVKYLFPQILAAFSLFSILAFVHINFLFFLLFLVFLNPLPAKWRTDYEANGYAMNLYFDWQTSNKDYDIAPRAKELALLFTHSSYWYMCWSADKAFNLILDKYNKLQNSHAAFVEVTEWISHKNQSPSPQQK